MEHLRHFFEETCPSCGHGWLPAPMLWIAIGLLGQVVFTARFLLQWIVSERRGESVIPVGFWYLSIIGSLTVLAYALFRRDPVFILAYLFNSFIYARNLSLIARKGGSISPFAVTRKPS